MRTLWLSVTLMILAVVMGACTSALPPTPTVEAPPAATQTPTAEPAPTEAATATAAATDEAGNFLGTWGGPGTGDGQFRHPLAVAVDSQGNIYVSDETNRIQKFRATNGKEETE